MDFSICCARKLNHAHKSEKMQLYSDTCVHDHTSVMIPPKHEKHPLHAQCLQRKAAILQKSRLGALELIVVVQWACSLFCQMVSICSLINFFEISRAFLFPLGALSTENPYSDL